MNVNDSDRALTHLFKQHRADISYKATTHLKTQVLSDLFSEPKERVSLLSWMSFGGGALATCLALLMAFQFGRMSIENNNDQMMTQEVISAHIRSLMVEHLSDVISTDQHTVKPWFEGKIDFGPTVKDFAKEGFPLIGGRLDYIGGRATAAVVYKSSRHYINVFQYPSVSQGNAQPLLKSIRGYQVFSWTRDGMSYWAVSDVNAADLQTFVSLWP